MTSELENAINQAYEVFARYNLPRDLVLTPGKAYHLRSLTREDWDELGRENDLTVRMWERDSPLLRHFLPRWLEWLSADNARRRADYWSIWELWRLEGYLNAFEWHSWPVAEMTALRAVFLAWTREDVAKYGGEPSFQFLIDIGEDLAPHLEAWLAADLLVFARWLWSANWPAMPGAQHWVASSRLESELEAAFFADADGPNAELFSRSIELVRSLRAL